MIKKPTTRKLIAVVSGLTLTILAVSVLYWTTVQVLRLLSNLYYEVYFFNSTILLKLIPIAVVFGILLILLRKKQKHIEAVIALASIVLTCAFFLIGYSDQQSSRLQSVHIVNATNCLFANDIASLRENNNGESYPVLFYETKLLKDNLALLYSINKSTSSMAVIHQSIIQMDKSNTILNNLHLFDAIHLTDIPQEEKLNYIKRQTTEMFKVADYVTSTYSCPDNGS
jgi:cytochrome c biogenesis factor